MRAVGGGAGGNYSSGKYAGVAGGSGGGATYNNSQTVGAGTAGQGNAGGTGNDKNNATAGGGGGAGRAGGGASSDNPSSAGGGGQGFRTDISGTATYYAGGGGGGGNYRNANGNDSVPGGGGTGGGGEGGMQPPASGSVTYSALAKSGTDGLGGGGGGGSNVSGCYQGGNGGSGVVILRYTVQGSGAGSDEPVVTLETAEYAGDLKISGAYRLPWAGEGFETADVYVRWGYTPNALTHSVKVAEDAIGTGDWTFTVPVDQTTIYLRLAAVNGCGCEGLSDRIVSIEIPEYDGYVPGDHTIPVFGDVALARADGLFATIGGTVASFGEAGEGEDPIDGCVVYAYLGTTDDITRMAKQDEIAVEPGVAFTVPVTDLAPATTYYWYLEARNSAGNVVATAVDSFTTKGMSIVNDMVSASPNQRAFTANGSLSEAGAGDTTIYFRWGTGNSVDANVVDDWTVVKTIPGGSAGDALTFSARAASTVWGAAWYSFMVSNACATIEGEYAGPFWTSVVSGTVTLDDTATYTWRAVDGVWDGNWSDAAHWSCDKTDNRGYPQSSGAAASFVNCTLDNPATITVDGDYTIGAFTPMGAGGSKLSFVGANTADRAKNALRTGVLPTFKSNSLLEFRNMTFVRRKVSDNANWNAMADTSGAIRNATLRFSNTAFSGVYDFIYAGGVDCSVEFLDGTTAQMSSKMSSGGQNMMVVIDESTLSPSAFYFPADEQSTASGQTVQFYGANPILKISNRFTDWSRSATPQIVFHVPEGGYGNAPIQLTNTSVKFGANNGSSDSGTSVYTFAVASDSPALFVNGALENCVVVSAAAGFVTERVNLTSYADGKGRSAALSYGKDGAKTADATAARQILLDLAGAAGAARTFLLVW